MTESTKFGRFWHWACSRGFVFLAYLAVSVSAVTLYLASPPPPVGTDFTISGIAALVSFSLIAAGLASAHAVIYGLRPFTIGLIKLEIPALKILAAIISLHGALDVYNGSVPGGAIQVGLAVLLFHEMRRLSELRKGPNGGHI